MDVLGIPSAAVRIGQQSGWHCSAIPALPRGEWAGVPGSFLRQCMAFGSRDPSPHSLSVAQLKLPGGGEPLAEASFSVNYPFPGASGGL